MNFMAFHELTLAWDTAYSDSREVVLSVYKNQKSDEKSDEKSDDKRPTI